MKGFNLCVVALLLFCGFTFDDPARGGIRNDAFGIGEELTYRVNFGIFTVGSARTKVDKEIVMMRSRPCYKIDGFGATTGMVSWFSKFDDQWGAYVDTSTLITHVSYRKLKEDNYRRDEIVTYDHEKEKAEVKVANKETGVYDNVKTYPIKKNVRDIVGGFMYLRNIDYDSHKKGDTIVVSGFMEDTYYNLKVIYDGKEKIKSNIGKLMCIRIVPIVPDNKLFDGENSITAWFSDDKNRVPVKIQAKMFIGHAGLELTSFRGLRNQLKIIK